MRNLTVRNLLPGDMPNRNAPGGNAAHYSRIHIAQITQIEELQGRFKAIIIGSGSPVTCALPAWLSQRSSSSAWMRLGYAEGDMVYIGYTQSLLPVCLGPATFGALPNATNPDGTYAALTDGLGVALARNALNVPGFRQLTPLKRGEFDIHASGGGYIYGTAGGALILGSGIPTLTFDKSTNEIDGSTGRFRVSGAGGSLLRVGQVKAALPVPPFGLTFPETPITGLSEAAVIVNDDPGTGIGLPRYALRVGNPITGLGIPEVRNAAPARVVEEVYDTAGVLVVAERSVTATGIVEQSAAVSNILSSSVRVALGTSTAVHPLAYGDAVLTALTNIASALTAVATALPIAAGPSAPAISAQVTAITNAAAAINTLISTPAQTLFSPKVFTE
jgi:hypothetical protein